MVTLRIEHPITEFDTWAAAFGRFAGARAAAGALAERVMRPVDDAHYVVVELDFETAAAADAFHAFLRTAVWPVADNAPALVGSPAVTVLERVTL